MRVSHCWRLAALVTVATGSSFPVAAQQLPPTTIHVAMPYAYFAGQGACAYRFIANFSGAADPVGALTLRIAGLTTVQGRSTRAWEEEIRFPDYSGARATAYQESSIERECVDRLVITRAVARIGNARPADVSAMIDVRPNTTPLAVAGRR